MSNQQKGILKTGSKHFLNKKTLLLMVKIWFLKLTLLMV